jgi:hypothetical protein
MDFPLVSILLFCDATTVYDMKQFKPAMEVLPGMAILNKVTVQNDVRSKDEREVKTPGEQVHCRGAATIASYTSHGLMKGLSQFVLSEFAGMGYKTAQQSALHPAVAKIWTDVPAPFTARVVSEADPAAYEEDVDGKLVKPLGASKTLCWRIIVSLQTDAVV